MVLVYVGNCIFFYTKKDTITKMLDKLRQDGLKIEPEHDMAGFLSVLIDRDKDKNTYTLTQTGLIEIIISALELEGVNSKRTRILMNAKDGNIFARDECRQW